MLLPYYERKGGDAPDQTEDPAPHKPGGMACLRLNRRQLVSASRILGAVAGISVFVLYVIATPRTILAPSLADDMFSAPHSALHPTASFPANETNRTKAAMDDDPVFESLMPLPLNQTGPPSIDFNDPAIQGELAVDALYSRQSVTLDQAIARYTLRAGHAPPPNYDRWFRFAKDRKCLIDEYDQIHRDFKPFYQLAERDPGYFQVMIDRAASQLDKSPAEICYVEVRNGSASLKGRTSYSGVWPNTFAKFSDFLPDMTFLINGRDEPRVAFNFRAPSALEHAFSVNDSNPFNIAPRPTAEFFRNQSGCNLPTEATGFMQSINEEHSFLIASATPGYTTDLYPIISMAKVSPCFADILFPTEYYYERSWWSGKFAYEDNIPWEEKKPQIYWRGMSTGGMIIGNNYHHFMRFKLASLARDHPDLMNVSITRFAETLCEAQCDRATVIADYNITLSAEARERTYAFKYAMDVDGTSFSGRFLLLLRSGSLVFKATLFEEYFNDWLRPFEHFIPVKPDLSDLVERIEWANTHEEEARLIQQRGQAVAKRVLTDDQNDCYFSAVLLEWARLQGYANGAQSR